MVLQVYEALAELYGSGNWWPIVEDGISHYKAEFLERSRSREEILEIAVGAILTQNTNWHNVEKSLQKLKSEQSLNIEALDKIPIERLEVLIRSSGYYRQKAKKIKGLITFIKTQLGGDLLQLRNPSAEEVRTALLSIWGVGEETADSIALYAYDFHFFIADSYSRRLFERIGISNTSYGDLQAIVQRALPANTLIYKEFHAFIVRFGKEFCRAKPLCQNCPLKASKYLSSLQNRGCLAQS